METWGPFSVTSVGDRLQDTSPSGPVTFDAKGALHVGGVSL